MSHVDLGSIIKRLLAMRPLSELPEGDSMVVAGQVGGAMREAIDERDMEWWRVLALNDAVAPTPEAVKASVIAERELGRHTKDEALRLLRQHIAECGSLREFARRNNVSAAFVSQVLNGESEPTDRVMSAIGLRRVVYYEPPPD